MNVAPDVEIVRARNRRRSRRAGFGEYPVGEDLRGVDRQVMAPWTLPSGWRGESIRTTAACTNTAFAVGIGRSRSSLQEPRFAFLELDDKRHSSAPAHLAS